MADCLHRRPNTLFNGCANNFVQLHVHALLLHPVGVWAFSTGILSKLRKLVPVRNVHLSIRNGLFLGVMSD